MYVTLLLVAQGIEKLSILAISFITTFFNLQQSSCTQENFSLYSDATDYEMSSDLDFYNTSPAINTTIICMFNQYITLGRFGTVLGRFGTGRFDPYCPVKTMEREAVIIDYFSGDSFQWRPDRKNSTGANFHNEGRND